MGPLMFLCRLLTATAMAVVVSGRWIEYSDTFEVVVDEGNDCRTVIHDFNPIVHKKKYHVGVFAAEGEDAVYEKYNRTFADYLTATAGLRFNPPIEFDLVPVTLTSLMSMAEEREVDFYFVSPSLSSCLETDYKARLLATVISRREYRGHFYDLDVYGGVMFALADNDNIRNIRDFKNKIIGAASVTSLGGGQTQFYEMSKEGLSYVSDPKQVVFTDNEFLTIEGVLNGDFDVGFARTDQIERYRDSNGNSLDHDVFKVINPQSHLLDDGTIFPFQVSSALNPEWPVAALDHVANDVSKEVQDALFGLRDHATALEIEESMRCDTTPEVSQIAQQARTSGLFTGFRTARSNFEVRTMQELDGFLRVADDGLMHCIQGESLYQDISCPDNQFKVTKEEFLNSCENAGLPCKEGYQCFCKPCIQAFEVDVFQFFGDSTTTSTEGCAKMSLCGKGEQTKDVAFRALDHRERSNASVEVIVHLNYEDSKLDVVKIPDQPYTYEFHWSPPTAGVGIMEIFIDGEQIPESPVRVQIVERDCAVDYPGSSRVAEDDGSCVCPSTTVYIRGKCLEKTVYVVAGCITALIVGTIAGLFYLRHKNRKNDTAWRVDLDELQFDDPAEVIGRGSFGEVLLAEYRGTKVAIKRAIRPRNGTAGSTRGKSWKPSSGGPADTGSPKRDQIVGSTRSLEDVVSCGSLESEEDVERAPTPTTILRRDSVISEGGSRRSSDGLSFGFLTDGRLKNSKWAWLFPWIKQEDSRSRYKRSILESGSMSRSRTMARRLCACFDEQAKRDQEFMDEMRVLSRLRHPAITTVMGAVVNRSHDPMLVMEYMDYGSLHDLLRNDTMYLSGEIILQITRDIAQGLRYLHSSKPVILHGDLKARNILIDSRFRAKLCDFGLSFKSTKKITGTPLWLAPEYLRLDSPYDANCDMYSMGMVFYEIYARKNPYEGELFQDVLRKVCHRRINKRPDIPKVTPPKMADLMKKCWSPNPSFRPIARDLDMQLADMCAQDAEPMTPEEQNRQRSGDMLYEIFPRHIADSLKVGKKIEPESHELVTVIFSDIVKFTDISRESSPMKVSGMLDRLYLAFDKLSKEHNVFKVETIGDAYMGVTNLEADMEHNHVKNIAEFAIAMINQASKILIDEDDPSRGYINIRVGFHSGPVVSNVIGSLNPRYGLFGDTVNVASRMESTSKANRILCSERAYKLLKKQAPNMPTRKRGKVDIKGKGEMYVYWVGGELIEVDSPSCDREGKKEVGFNMDHIEPLRG